MVLSLLEMQQFGGSNADAIKKALDSLFHKPSTFEIKEDQYRKCLVRPRLHEYGSTKVLFQKDSVWISVYTRPV